MNLEMGRLFLIMWRAQFNHKMFTKVLEWSQLGDIVTEAEVSERQRD